MTITTPQIIHVTLAPDGDQPGISLQLSFQAETQQYLPVSIEARHPMRPITVSALKKVAIHQLTLPLVRQEIAEHNTEILTPAAKRWVKGRPGRELPQKLCTAPSTKHLQDAVLVYRLARAARDHAVIAVARTMGIQHRDAQRWLRQAKKEELL